MLLLFKIMSGNLDPTYGTKETPRTRARKGGDSGFGERSPSHPEKKRKTPFGGPSGPPLVTGEERGVTG